jgi:type IV pilus assembly protein PilA
MLPQKSPLVVYAYGDQDAIRTETSSSGFDPALVLVGAAVAIPNLLRARTAANETSAVTTLRAIIAAEVSYSASYPQRGFAPNLAMLGSDPAAPETATANHAALIDATLGSPSCTASNWCEQSGYRFRITGQCRQRTCQDFVAVAMPVSMSTGTRHFCSTSDGVVRYRIGASVSVAPSPSDCQTWQPLR